MFAVTFWWPGTEWGLNFNWLRNVMAGGRIYNYQCHVFRMILTQYPNHLLWSRLFLGFRENQKKQWQKWWSYVPPHPIPIYILPIGSEGPNRPRSLMHLKWKDLTTNRHACRVFHGKPELKMAPNFCVRKEGPREAKMEPKWSQDEAKRGQDGPRRAKRGQDGAKMGPRRNQHGAKIKVQKSLKKTVF